MATVKLQGRVLVLLIGVVGRKGGRGGPVCCGLWWLGGGGSMSEEEKRTASRKGVEEEEEGREEGDFDMYTIYAVVARRSVKKKLYIYSA